MKKPFVILIFLLSLIFLNCSSKETKAQKLLETGQFEEQQNNTERASKIYREILEKYPDTKAADKVRYKKTGMPHDKSEPIF